ncbi:uncharacterized protein PFL1_00280 [Pseudozyma flocculosa PF-1]|uniref:Related to a retinal short-chain dehydrogenase/reductase n=1 Tax=Pseudozyma flocculosa TaxID=84751 RepID=A0A5C3ERW9_9BASI|nr:uncharacterized protein PFL1_00280 [Pseudozyma flocculosa PF-1]EPQ32082.1 hypothetical protein PFL1_00280 [Pseudozyma flocculosa PF-1]SPO34988.1 related to a retinal short-chain dehydrogenase/reductase [Pseudozyma flocculosa]
MVAVDTFVALSKWTVFNPLLAIAWLACEALSPHLVAEYRHLLALPCLILLGWTLTWSSAAWTNHPRLPRIQASQWKRELVVVTGGATGIGAHLALKLARRGAKVVTLDIQKADYASLGAAAPAQTELDDITPNIHPYICDVASLDALTKVVKSIRALHGDPTILINNAGITNSRPLVECSAAEVTKLLNVNLASPLWLIQSLLPGMLAAAEAGRACHIVSVSSIMGHVGISKMVDYCASKHGLVGLHRALRYEIRSHHRTHRIRTTLVILGHVRTRLFAGIYFNPLARFLAPSIEPEHVAERIVEAIDARREGTIALPWYANWTEGLAVLPSWGADAVQWMSGANTSFDAMHKAR